MSRFHIYSHDKLIGWSDLELGDAPMGVAFGVFAPAPEYFAIQKRVALSGDQAFLGLSARLADGTVLEAVAVCIADYSAELGDSGIEVSVLGISNPPYSELFPAHIAAYEQQFPVGD